MSFEQPFNFVDNYFQSEYSGQIRTLMGYIDPKTDIVVAAGGDGTLFEVCKSKILTHAHAHIQ